MSVTYQYFKSEMVDTQEKPTVLITGFGPFGNYKLNASWESVKLLSDMNIEEELGIQLITKEIPVSYKYITENIPDMWKLYKPQFVIHVGVSCIATDITLEKCAHKFGYLRRDIDDCCPEDGSCLYGNDDELHCMINVEEISNAVNSAKLDVCTSVSTNAGRYLCEFVYYTSLSMNNARALFIHVPELGKPYSAKQIAQGLKEIIKVIIENYYKCKNSTR